jgi:hypothetical protein
MQVAVHKQRVQRNTRLGEMEMRWRTESLVVRKQQSTGVQISLQLMGKNGLVRLSVKVCNFISSQLRKAAIFQTAAP